MEITSLSSDQLRLLKERLLSTKEENLNFLRYFSSELKGEKIGDMADIASLEINAKEETRKRSRYIEIEKDLNGALEKITAGEYGLCEDCDGNIGLRRLENNPTALRCVICQERRELN